MNNLFPVGGGAQTYGMPDMNAGNGEGLNTILSTLRQHRNLRAEDDDNRAIRQQQSQPQLQNIAAQMAQTNRPPMPGQDDYGRDVKFDPTPAGMITPYQQAQLDIQKKTLEQRGNLGQQKLDQTGAVAARKAILAEKIASGRATDDEKHEHRMIEINERGNVQSDQIDQRGSITSRQIGERGDIQKELQNTRGTQNLDAIAAGIAGRQQLQDSRSADPLSPSQQGSQHINAIQRLRLSNPALGQLIIEDEFGNIQLDPKTTPEERRAIESSIYSSGDIQLPAGDKPVSSTPLTTKPLTSKPAVEPVKSKYKVTVK